MSRTDTFFVAIMLSMQFDLTGCIWVTFSYYILGKILKKIKDYYLTLTIPIL